MSPDPLMILSAMLAANPRCHGRKRAAPTRICDAFTPRAKASIASARSSPVTVWNSPPISSVSRLSSASWLSGVVTRPSVRATYTPSNCPPARRDAIRAPRRSSVSPSGPPDSATTTRSRVGQFEVMPWSRR